MKKYGFLFLVLIAVVGIVAYFQYFKAHIDTSEAKADVVLSAEKLLELYETNEKKADSMYLDKIIEIQGRIKSLNTVEVGSSLSLETGSDMAGITCEFESKDAFQGVKIGEQVKIKGICSGKLIDVVLVRCSLAK